MKKEDLLAKLEEGAATLRAAVEQHDGSSLKTITETVKHGFESVKDHFGQSETAQKALTEMKKHYDDLGDAVGKGDRKLTAKILGVIESKIAECKEKKE